MGGNILSKLKRKPSLLEPKIFCRSLEQTIRCWRLAKLLILFLSSWLAVTIFINSNVPTVAQEQVSSNPALIYTYVRFDGRKLFPVAAMAAKNSSGASGSLLPMNMRVKRYQRQLQKIVSQGFGSLTVTYRNSAGQTAIVASDRLRSQSWQIGNVTKLDAQIHGLSIPVLAEQWSNIIHSALIQAQQERQPQYIRRQLFLSGGIVLAMMLLCSLFVIWQKRLKSEWENLQLQKDSLITQEENFNLSQINASSQTELINVMEQKTIWERQKNLNVLKRGLLQIGHVIVWLVGLTYILGLFPYTRQLQGWLFTKWELVGIILGTYAAIRISAVVIDRILQGLLEKDRETNILSKRRKLRLTTFLHVIGGIINYALVLIGVFLVLAHLRIPIAPLLAGAGIVGFAISFGSQNLIRDIINGSLIVLEDQYAIGDVITAGEAAGFVEDMNLRMTQLRGAGGRLTTIPNSSISIVHNLTKDWSRFEFSIRLPHDVDIERAMKIIEQVAQQMQSDREWQEQIIDPVNVLGVNDISETGVEIILWLKTQPLQQFVVGREFRRRLKLALDREGIAIGIPRYLLGLEN